ncbi:transposable element Tcb2 transposase [Trichonephila clavipes]|nr:transposable element Tcb2 transposase [Trichonephila clavipes]
MNKESATVALRKFRFQINVKTGKGPSTVVCLIKTDQRFEETGSLEDRVRSGQPNLRIISKRWKLTWPPLSPDPTPRKSPGRLHTWKNYRKSWRRGRTITSVAADSTQLNQQSWRRGRTITSVVSRAWKAFQTTGTAVRKISGGHPRTTTAGDDRYIILLAKRGRRQSASVIAQQLSTATGRQIPHFTVARRLHKGGLFARRPERCLPLKVDHRHHRLQWCREHKNWTTVNGVVSFLRMRVG